MSNIYNEQPNNEGLKKIGSFIYKHFKFVFCVIWFTYLNLYIVQGVNGRLSNLSYDVNETRMRVKDMEKSNEELYKRFVKQRFTVMDDDF